VDVPTLNIALPPGVVDPTERTPKNEDVAVVEVAKYALAVGVDDETMFPELSVVRSMLVPIPESVKAEDIFAFVAKRLVNVPVLEKRLVVVACVVVLRSAKNPPVNVDEAVDMKPSKKPRVVEVALPHV
jgi:hypothetical protein